MHDNGAIVEMFKELWVSSSEETLGGRNTILGSHQEILRVEDMDYVK